MQLQIRGSSNYVLNVEGTEDISALKSLIAQQEGCSQEDILAYVQGKPLSEEGDVSALENFTIDVTVPLKGGKVHGSLARAGKVRGQTPKEAKKEGKKSVTGRAHKRLQYNRRFVNVTVGMGKKRGPNSNS